MPDDTCAEDWDATPAAILHRQAIMAAGLATIFVVAAVRGLVRLPGRALQRLASSPPTGAQGPRGGEVAPGALRISRPSGRPFCPGCTSLMLANRDVPGGWVCNYCGVDVPPPAVLWRVIRAPDGTLAILSDRQPGPRVGQPGELSGWTEVNDPPAWVGFEAALEMARRHNEGRR